MGGLLCLVDNRAIPPIRFIQHLKYIGYTPGRYAFEYDIPVHFNKGSIQLHQEMCLVCNSDLRLRVDRKGNLHLLGCTKCKSNKQIETLLSYVCTPEEITTITTTLYTTKPGTSLERMIERYGKNEGKKRYEKWKLGARQDKVSFIKRYGKILGNQKYEQFVNKSKQTKENFIKRFGKEQGEIQYLEYVNLKKDTSPRSVEYWTNLGFDLAEAQEKVKYHQDNSSLDKHIIRYGDDLGRKKYAEYIKRNKFKVLKSFRQKYGKDGDLKYQEYRESIRIKKGYSVVSQELFDALQHRFPKLVMFYGENEFTIARQNRVVYPDCFIPTLNIVIEFYGDKYHANPKLFKSNDKPHPFNHKITAKEIWKYDLERQQIIETEQTCLIVWEYDYRNDKDLVLSKLEEFINDKLKG